MRKEGQVRKEMRKEEEEEKGMEGEGGKRKGNRYSHIKGKDYFHRPLSIVRTRLK